MFLAPSAADHGELRMRFHMGLCRRQPAVPQDAIAIKELHKRDPLGQRRHARIAGPRGGEGVLHVQLDHFRAQPPRRSDGPVGRAAVDIDDLCHLPR